MIVDDPLLGISPGSAWSAADLIAGAQRAADGGLGALLLREVEREAAELERIVEALSPRLRLVLHLGNPAAARIAGERGLRLHAPDGADGGPRPWSQSVHDGAGLQRAAARGCAAVLVAPVFSPGSKPGDLRPTLGLWGLRALVAQSPLPVYALGGVGPNNAAALREAGAAGMATITGIFGPADPAAAARALIAAWGP